MTEAELIDGVLKREGLFREAVQRPDGTWDPMTFRGITATTLGEWRQLGRQATREELLGMPIEETRLIYRRLYVEGPGFISEQVPFEALRETLIDFGINSGQARATRYLQRAVRVEVTGVMDRRTVAWLHDHRGFLWLVNDTLCAARLQMISGAVKAGTIRKQDKNGLMTRALGFVLTRS